MMILGSRQLVLSHLPGRGRSARIVACRGHRLRRPQAERGLSPPPPLAVILEDSNRVSWDCCCDTGTGASNPGAAAGSSPGRRLPGQRAGRNGRGRRAHARRGAAPAPCCPSPPGQQGSHPGPDQAPLPVLMKDLFLQNGRSGEGVRGFAREFDILAPVLLVYVGVWMSGVVRKAGLDLSCQGRLMSRGRGWRARGCRARLVGGRSGGNQGAVLVDGADAVA
jgi:hypothetical protein